MNCKQSLRYFPRRVGNIQRAKSAFETSTVVKFTTVDFKSQSLKPLRVARTRLQRTREFDARVGHELTGGQMLGRRVDDRLGPRRLVAKLEGRRIVGAARAAEGAGGNELPRDTLGGGPGPPVQLRFQVHEGARDDRDLGTAHETQGIALLVRVLKLDGHLRVGKHTRILLIPHRGTVGCEDVVPSRIPGRRFAGDIHSTYGFSF